MQLQWHVETVASYRVLPGNCKVHRHFHTSLVVIVPAKLLKSQKALKISLFKWETVSQHVLSWVPVMLLLSMHWFINPFARRFPRKFLPWTPLPWLEPVLLLCSQNASRKENES
mmetsp:Transcript_99217/g.277847  ORF Transcript_99217/g.277847 Transcript_99217/m.277847 type:complete len:114 (+) Transcript_99217:187-528(+)